MYIIKNLKKLKLTEESGYYYITIRIPDSKIPVKIRIHRLHIKNLSEIKYLKKGLLLGILTEIQKQLLW